MVENTIELYRPDISTSLVLPYVDGGISAGFPSPTQDSMDLSIDLNRELMQNLVTTFLRGTSPDTSQEAQHEDVCIRHPDEEFTTKYIGFDEKDTHVIWLLPDNDMYKPLFFRLWEELSTKGSPYLPFVPFPEGSRWKCVGGLMELQMKIQEFTK